MIYLAILLDLFYKPFAPILVFFALFTAKKVSDLNIHNYQINIPRYKLPSFLGWMETKDELLPGDISIQAVSDIYLKWGWFIAGWYWLGLRNTGSILWYFGKEAPNYLACMTPEQESQYGIYQNEHKLGFIKILTGWNVYRDWYSVYTNDGFWATPYLSLRFA